MTDKQPFDLAVLGAGPGGYVAAIRAAQLGLRVCLIERRRTLGGTCLNVGCIPSKALLESSELFAVARRQMAEHGVTVGEPALDLRRMMQRKQGIVDELVGGLEQLMKKNKVTIAWGRGELLGPGRLRVEGEQGSEEIKANSIILAMGSEPVALPLLPIDEKRVVSSTGALAFDAVPDRLLVVGAGVIGLELGSVWARLGAAVTVVELLPRILPGSDDRMAKLLQRALKRQGLDFRLGCRVKTAEVKRGGVAVGFEDAAGEAQRLEADKVLVAVGRRPVTAGAGLDRVGIKLDDEGRVAVDERWRTNVEGIYAIGDLIRGPMLAHKAEEEGVAVAEILVGKPGHVNYEAIPSIVYTWPELAEVGLSEEAAKDRGVEYRVGRYSFKPNGRAKTLVGENEGQVKLLADAKTDRLIGAQIVGPRASDMIAELVLAFEFGASAEDVARAVHAHPTLSEIVKEAALAVDGRPIHG